MTTAAVVLAGGMSRRMGRDKAMLPFGEGTMLSHLVELYRPYFDLIAVSLNSPHRFQTYGALEIVDRHPGDGPLAGLEAAFLDTGADLIFLTATDLPFGDPALAQFLLEQRGSHDVCLIRHGGRAETLFAIYSSACLPVIQRSLEDGRRSIFHVIKQMDTLELPAEALPQFDLDHILRNVNDPEEYRRAMELLGR